MRWGPKTLLAALVVLALGAGLVACGGGDDSDTDTTEAAQGQPARDGYGSSGDGSSGFAPREHEDSGGGSDQFRVKGGDNSIQEFGEEASASEFEEAAVALHGFLDARAAGDWAAACEHLASSVVDSLRELAKQRSGKVSCAEILRGLTNPAAGDLLREEAEEADVGSLRIEDERAFVIYRGVEGEVLATAMAQEDGAWKVAALAGTPLL